MPIFLDDDPVELAGDDLAAVLLSAREQAQQQGRVVVEVQLDGESITADQIDHAAQIAVAEREVRLYSADPHQLARATLEQVRARLNEVRDKQAQAAEHLQQDQADQAMLALREMIDVWLQTQQALVNTAVLLGIDLNDLSTDGMSFDDVAAELLEKLQEIKQLLEGRDSVGLADVLAYEWPTLIDRWDGLIEALLAKINDN